MKLSRIISVVVSVYFSVQLLAAAEYQASIHPSRLDKPKPTHDILQIEFSDAEENPGYLIVSDAVLSPASYELFGRKGSSTTALEINKIEPIPGNGLAAELIIYPKEPLQYNNYDSFEFKVKNNSIWKFKDGASWKNEGGGVFLVVKSDRFKMNANYYRHFSGFQNHVDTGHKFDAGVVSLEVHYQARTSEESTQSDAYLFLFNAKGDFVFPKKEKIGFTNSLNADLEFVYSHLPDTFKSSAPAGSLVDPHHIPPPENRWEPFWDLGVSAKYESDQNFDNVNLLAGVVAHIILRNPVTDSLQRGILLNEPLFLNPKRIVVATIAPLITFRYDYVSNVKEGQSLDTGQNRVTGALFYRLPLAREIDILKSTGLTQQVFDSDFVAELEGVYDFDKKKYANNSKLTLEIVPHTDAQHQPAFILTYAQGKTTPTFQHFDAFLAGLKIPF
jgi:hypothetical protein